MATYTISTLTQLQAMSSHLTDDCVLDNDIDASTTKYWNPGTGANAGINYGFAPVDGFGGTFDGAGHKIKNLYIRRIQSEGATLYDRAGLFGSINNSAGIELKDVTLENVDITGGTRAGSLFGFHYTNASACTISGITVSGTVENTVAGVAGGLGGSGGAETISDCDVSVNVTAVGSAGGLLGDRYTGAVVGSITSCTFNGNINAAINGADYVGGVYGYNTVSITDCVTSGTITVTGVSATVSYAGGIAGSLSAAATTSHSYMDINGLATGTVLVGGFVGRTTAAITVSSAHGDVNNAATAGSKTGGFAGEAEGASADISNCFAVGSVCLNGIGHAGATFGGFMGNLANAANDLTNCYSTGQVLTGVGVGGGFLGTKAGATPTITSCYWDTETSGYATSAAGTGKTTEQMKTSTTFVNWDFATVWLMPTLSRSPGSGTTMWLSETSDYDNFEAGVKDADSFELELPTGDSINWIEALQSLLAGTGGSEWRIGTSKLDTPLTPTNFVAKQQSTYGAANIQPKRVNDSILFIDFVKRKVRELTFDGDKYVAPDMTSLAEHITATGITCLAQQKNPDTIIWCVLTDGSLLSFTYDRSQNVTAWADHPIDGTVQSVAVIPNASAGEDEVWLSIGRTIDDTEVTYIERMASRVVAAKADAFFVDSGLTYSGAASNTLTAAHLALETVSVLGTKAGVTTIYNDLTVAAGGTITLPDAATVTSAVFGLPFIAKVQPMRIVMNTPAGSSMGSITKVSELVLSLRDSCNVQYGAVDTDLYPVDLTAPELEDSSEITGLFSGDVVLAHPGGFSVQSPIVVVSEDPVPFNLRAIVARLEQTGR